MKKIFQRTKFPFIMTIITCLLSFVFFFLSNGESWNYRYIIILIGLFPFTLFLIITAFTNILFEKKYTKIISMITTTILTFGCIVYYFVGILFCVVLILQHPVKDVNYYHHFVSSSYLLQVFPKKIPSSAKKVKLVYSPKFLQAPVETTLYYIDDKMDLKTFDKLYRKKAKWVGYLSENKEKENLLDGFLINTPISEKNKDSFQIYLIKGNCDDSGYCNHGNYLIASMNPETKEVIFSSKEW